MTAELFAIQRWCSAQCLRRCFGWFDVRLSRDCNWMLLDVRMIRGDVINTRLTLCVHTWFRMERCYGCRIRWSDIWYKIRFVRGCDSMIVDIRMSGKHVTRHWRQYNALWFRPFRFRIHHFRDWWPCVQILPHKWNKNENTIYNIRSNQQLHFDVPLNSHQHYSYCTARRA